MKHLLYCLGFCALGLPLVVVAQTTIQNTSYTSGQTVGVSGPSTIVAGPSVSVSSSANVTYYASSRITLSPGFTAATGSSFRAIITSGVTTYTLSVQNGTGSIAGLPVGAVQTITANSPGSGESFVNWTLISGLGSIANPNAATTTFTMGASDATVRANFSNPDPNADSDGDGVTNGVELSLGLNPYDPTDVNVQTFTYDKINQLKRGPGGEYKKDAEGNIKEVRQ